MIQFFAVLLAFLLVVSPVVGYAIFSRYLAHKEKAALREFGLWPIEEVRYE